MQRSHVTRAASFLAREPARPRIVGVLAQAPGGARELGGVGRGDIAGAAVRDHLEGPARVGGSQHRLLGQERLVRDHPEVLVDGRVVDGEAAGVERRELVLVDAPRELGAAVQPRSAASDSSRTRSGPSPAITTRSAGSSAAASSRRSFPAARSSRPTERTKSP